VEFRFRRARDVAFHFFFLFRVDVCYASDSRYCGLATALRGSVEAAETEKNGGKKSNGKRKRSTAKNGVRITGIANGNITNSLVSCLKEINACLRTRVIRPRNSSPSSEEVTPRERLHEIWTSQ